MMPSVSCVDLVTDQVSGPLAKKLFGVFIEMGPYLAGWQYISDSELKSKVLKRGPNLFFKYFYFLFGPGLFYPLRVIATVQIFFGTLVGPLTLLHPKMKLLRCREPREPETLVFLHFTWFYDYEIRVQSTSHFPHSCLE